MAAVAAASPLPKKRDTVDAIAKVGEGEVFINVALRGQGALGRATNKAARQEKLGPRREHVASLYGSRGPPS
ncbi:MAG: hypothetical protein M3N68_08970 [Actinomycetota bacterium]|nr:hypothetical protein [Actinomycetota bacterium]